MQPRRMATWVDGTGRVVGHISQGVGRNDQGRPVATYIAEAVGLPADTCFRFQCAKNKVEGALVVAGIRATALV